MVRRLIAFLVVMLVLFAGLEGLVRVKEDAFAALSDRFLLREQLIKEASSETEVVVLGTSRMLDAVDQGILAESLGGNTGGERKCFNTAIAGVNVEILETLAEAVAKKDGVKLVLIEASTPSLTQQPVNRDGEVVEVAEEPTSNENRFPDRLEEALRSWMYDRFAVVRQRKALRPKTFVKMLVVATADVIDPNLWDRRGVGRSLIAAITGKTPVVPEGFLVPEVVKAEGAQVEPVAEGEDNVVSLIVHLSSLLQDQGKQVIWVVPPVGESAVAGENHDSRLASYQRAVAESGTILLNYSGSGLEERYLRDKTHLNIEGRAMFSVVLGRDVAALGAKAAGGGQ